MKNDLSNFSGSYALFQDDKCSDSGSSGYANKMFEYPNSPELAYGSASCTKAFTATAILILVSQNKLALTDLASKYLSSEKFLNKNITIHSLLTHTSGVADYFDESVMSDFAELWKDKPNYSYTKPQDFFALINEASKNNTQTINNEFKYSNSGFVILAAIVEKISGLSFTDFVQQNIFDNAKMNHTGFYRFDETPKNKIVMATGYTQNNKTNIYSLPVIGGGDGGVFISVLDMNKFWLWFENGACDKNNICQISNELINKAWSILATEHYDGNDGDSYGYGFWIQKNNPDTIMIQGFDPGVCFFSFYNRKTKRSFTLAQNDEATNADELFKNYELCNFK